MTRIYTTWPADREGRPATTARALHQETRWLVLDITDGIADARVVEGPVSRASALKRELELRAIARQTARDQRRAGTLR